MNVPSGQGKHAEEELAPVSVFHVPAGHGRQFEAVLALTTVLYVPASQASHDVAPGYAEYEPTEQLTHIEGCTVLPSRALNTSTCPVHVGSRLTSEKGLALSHANFGRRRPKRTLQALRVVVPRCISTYWTKLEFTAAISAGEGPRGCHDTGASGHSAGVWIVCPWAADSARRRIGRIRVGVVCTWATCNQVDSASAIKSWSATLAC